VVAGFWMERAVTVFAAVALRCSSVRFGSLRGLRFAGAGEEPHFAFAEEQHRIEVERAAFEAEVEADLAGAGRVVGLEAADGLARGDGLAGDHEGFDRFIGGAEAVVVDDADHAPPGEVVGEDDRAGARGGDGEAGSGGEIDAAVAWEPRFWRRIEAGEEVEGADRGAPGAGGGGVRGVGLFRSGRVGLGDGRADDGGGGQE
jgi:hypothetical protein